ncbi:MAG: DUF4270 domain-containing protein [Lentimicrobiaceae bacterium]|nr:DUF4270 domain-containing protein [Lentimicrobiaceae bacterium]
MMHFITACWKTRPPEKAFIVDSYFHPVILKAVLPLSRMHIWMILLVLLAMATSCKKDPLEVGLEVQPVEDRFNFKFSDTTTVIPYSLANDSVRTDETSLNMAGSYADPVFGLTNASFYTQFLLSNVKPDFGASPVLDSMILSLAIAGYYGDTNQPMTIRIHEVTQQLYDDSNYYSHSHLEYDLNPICTYTFYPRPNDSVMIDSVKYPAHLRINLGQNPAFANKILNGSELNLADNENFVQFINGLYITTDQAGSGGSILYFRLSSSLSKISLHYSNSENDSLSYTFRLDESCARFNRFTHDYGFGSPSLQAQVVNKDTSQGLQVFYLQSMQGINAVVHLPNILGWNQGKGIALTMAELVLPVIPDRQNYSAPGQLLLGLRQDGDIVQITDQSEGSTFLGGTYDSTRQEYRFRITRHMQKVLSGSIANDPLIVLVSARAIQANRAVIGGPLQPVRKTRLEMTYMELP